MNRLLLLCLACCFSVFTQAADKPELVLLTWEDYLDPTVIADFEQEYHCSVRRVYFDDDDERNMILANTRATGFDVVTVDQIMLEHYRKQDWLRPLTYADIPNARHARDPWQNAAAPEPFFAVSYFWGGVGILYRKDRIPTPPTHWRDIFQPEPYLKGRIMLLNTVQVAYGLALMSLGHPFNSTDPVHIAAATDTLMQVRPYVHAFRNIRIGPESELLGEEVYAAVTYNGDAITVMNYSDQLAFSYPADGVPLWLDLNVVLKNARQPALALKFLDFLNRPEIAARNAQALHYATTNVAALKLLPTSFLQDPRIFPDHSTMSRNQLYAPLPAPHLRRITAQLVQIMAQQEHAR